MAPRYHPLVSATILWLQVGAFAPQSLAGPARSVAVCAEEIEVVRQPEETWLKAKGVFDWGTWGCEVSKFAWTYGESEQCYLLAGDVTVTPTDGRSPATFGKGDFVRFPAGMSCTWDVRAPVRKHFLFG